MTNDYYHIDNLKIIAQAYTSDDNEQRYARFVRDIVIAKNKHFTDETLDADAEQKLVSLLDELTNNQTL